MAPRVIPWTRTAIVRALLKGGMPLSLTRTEMRFVPAGWLAGTLQVKRPFVGLITASGGAPGSRLNVKVCGGASGSVAAMAKLRELPVHTVCWGTAASTGGELVNWFLPFAVGTLKKKMLVLPS